MQIRTELSTPFVDACGELSSASPSHYETGETIYAARTENRAYVVASGYVRLSFLQANGRSWTRMVFGKGALIGDAPFRPRFFHVDEQAIANGQITVLEIDRRELETTAKRNPDFQLMLLRIVASQLQFCDRRIQWQLITPLRARVAKALADLLCFADEKRENGRFIDLRLTHEDFSQFVVAARPAVTDVLKDLKAAGIIDYSRSHFSLLDVAKLRAIAETKDSCDN
jgi:CRP/FNR family cyclic AMP-dependent transcriptional regulator